MSAFLFLLLLNHSRWVAVFPPSDRFLPGDAVAEDLYRAVWVNLLGVVDVHFDVFIHACPPT